jgi:hypothetical protein
MATHASLNRSVQRRALRAGKAVVALLCIVTLSYLTITSIELSLASRDASSALFGARTSVTVDAATGAVVKQGPVEATGSAVPCATFPDMTCPSRDYANPAVDAEPNPPTF